MRLYTPISKAEPQDDGSLIVVGRATDETLDTQGEIVKFEAAKKAFQEWEARNIREMHDPKKAVGKAIDVLVDDENKAVDLRVRISAGAKDTQAKILDGTLSGFSIGGEVHDGGRVARKTDDGTVIELTSFSLSEVSVVDAPANPSSQFSVAKVSDGEIVFAEIADETVEKAADVDAEEKAEDVEEDDAEKRIRELSEKIADLEEKLAASAVDEDDDAEKASDMPEESKPVSKISEEMRDEIREVVFRHIDAALDELVERMEDGEAAESVEVADDDIMEMNDKSKPTGDVAKSAGLDRIEKAISPLIDRVEEIAAELEKRDAAVKARIERMESTPVLDNRPPPVAVEKSLGAATDRLAEIGYSDPSDRMAKAMAHILNSNPNSDTIPKDELRTQLALLMSRI